jgi:hypothetical protein
MNELLALFGLTTAEVVPLAMMAVAAVVALFILRLIFRLSMTLIRLGCAVIVLGVGMVVLLQMMS